MASGDKPRIRVAIKPKDGGERISLIAAWQRDDGKLSATLDRRIVELAVKLDDGSIVRVKRGADGKASHWIDVFDNAAQSSPRHESRKQETQEAFADFGDDDVPF